MVSVESQPFSSCAMMSALITADCFCSGGYFATSRSIFFSESVVSMRNPVFRSSTASDLALPVIDVARCRLGRMAPFAVEGDELSGVGILADLRVGHGAYREVAQIGVGVVDDLVRGLGPADRAADDVAGADPARLGAVAQHPAARDDEEHLFLRAMAVERTGALARRHDVVRAAELARAEERPDARAARSVFFPF